MSNKREIAKIAREVREIKAQLNKSASQMALVTSRGGNASDWKKVRSMKEAAEIAEDWDAVLQGRSNEEEFENFHGDTIGDENSIYFRDGSDFYEWDWERARFSPTTEGSMGIWR